MRAVILAAGMGTRLRPLTENTPKCLIKVRGKPIIENALEHLFGYGIDNAVIVVGHLGDQVQQYLGSRFQGIKITYVVNKIFHVTGNSYSLWLARDHLNDDIILLEDDIFFEAEVIELLCNSKYPDIMVVDKFSDFMNGTCINADGGLVTGVFVGGKHPGEICGRPELKTVNIYKLSRGFMETHFVPALDRIIEDGHHDEFYEYAIGELVKANTVRLMALSVSGLKWIEIDTPDDLQAAESLFALESTDNSTTAII